MFQGWAIAKSVTFKREQLDKASAIYSANHEKVRQEAFKHGNLTQLERLEGRMVKSEIHFDKSN